MEKDPYTPIIVLCIDSFELYHQFRWTAGKKYKAIKSTVDDLWHVMDNNNKIAILDQIDFDNAFSIESDLEGDYEKKE